MKSRFQYLKNLINRIFPTRFSRLAMIVVICLPLVYSALYLWAFWDPYSHLDQLPVAFVNLDRGGVQDGQPKNIGNELTDELKSDNTLKWAFTTQAEAEQGLAQKKYYSYILVPEDFTQSVLSVDQNQPHKATLELKTRQASGVISGTIVNRVAYEITEKLSHKVSQEYLDNIFVQSRDTLQNIKKAADGANDLQSGLVDLKTGSHDLKEGVQTALNGGQDLEKGITDALSGGKSLYSGLYSAREGTANLSSGLGDAHDGAVTLHDKLSTASSGAQSLASGVQTAYQGSTALSDGIKKAAAGATALSQGLQSADAGAGTLSAGITSATTQLAALQQGVAGVSQLAAAVQGQSQAVASTSGDLASGMAQFINDHPDLAGDSKIQDLQQKVAALEQQSAVMSGTATKLAQTQSAVAGGFSSGATAIGQLSAGATQLQTALDQLSAGGSSLATSMTTIQQGAGTLATGLSSAATGSTSLSSGLSQLTDGASSLASGIASAKDGAETLYSGLDRLTGGSGQLVNGLASLQSGSDQMVSGLTDLHDGSQKLENGLTDAASGSQELHQQLEDGYEKSVSNLSETKTAKEEPVMADPVQLNEQITDPVSTYGTGFTPYFIPLSLWVGAMAIFFLSKMMTNADARQFQPFHLLSETFQRYVIFSVIGVLQAVVLDIVLMKTLGLSPMHLGLFFGFTILSSLLDIAIFQFLTTLFGEPAGTFIGVVLLMLQLTSSGGTYPRETIPQFFNVIAPYLPMTYVVSGLRDIISAGQVNMEPVMVTFAFFILIFLLATAALKRIFAELDQSFRNWGTPSIGLEYALAEGGSRPEPLGPQPAQSNRRFKAGHLLGRLRERRTAHKQRQQKN